MESKHIAFGPDTIAVLATAFEDTLRQLRLVDRNDPAVTMVAKRMIELARQGERDPIRLREQTIQSFRSSAVAMLDDLGRNLGGPNNEERSK